MWAAVGECKSAGCRLSSRRGPLSRDPQRSGGPWLPAYRNH